MLLVIGKGGVGKTTIAAATAAASARAGRSVLLVSLDRAHSLRDVLAGPEAPADQPWNAADGFEVWEPNVLAAIGERLEPVTRLAATVGGDRLPGMLDPQELTVVPGLEELVGLSTVLGRAERGDKDLVVVDCPPTAEALRAIDLPAALTSYLERLWPRHRRLTQGAGSATAMIAVGAVENLAAEADRVRAALADTDRTRAVLVTAPEPVAVAEARRTITAAALFALPVAAIVLNRVLPDADATGDDPVHHWYRTRVAEQDAVRVRVDRAAGDVPVLTVPFAAPAPAGPDELATLGAQAGLAAVFDIADPAPPAAPVLVSGSGLDSVYRYDIALPLVDPDTVGLGRVDDDLVVTAAGVRRRVRLPSVLRRCTVTGADLDDGTLRVQFAPDPAVWPL